MIMRLLSDDEGIGAATNIPALGSLMSGVWVQQQDRKRTPLVGRGFDQTYSR